MTVKKVRISFFTLILFIMVFWSSSVSAGIDSSANNLRIDWKKAGSSPTLIAKYKFLMKEYKRLYLSAEKRISPAFSQSSRVIPELYAALDEEMIKISIFPYQQFSADNKMPLSESILSDQEINRILDRCYKGGETAAISKSLRADLINLMNLYLGAQAYEQLVSGLEDANVVFSEDFESGNLGRWNISGKQDEIRIDSQRKAQGRHSLKIQTFDDNHNCLIGVTGLHINDERLAIEWKVWLPFMENDSDFQFRMLGMLCYWRKKEGKHYLYFTGFKKNSIAEKKPGQWYHIRLIRDPMNQTYSVFINGDLHFTNISFKIYEPGQNINHKSIHFTGFFYSKNSAWIDDIKVSYIH